MPFSEQHCTTIFIDYNRIQWRYLNYFNILSGKQITGGTGLCTPLKAK